MNMENVKELSLKKAFKLNASANRLFQYFVNDLGEWWPKEYTWSQDSLVEIGVEPKENGLCSEIGPFGFRCDWGRVTTLNPGKKIVLKWQISPRREPVPNPEKASEIEITFSEINAQTTQFQLEHRDFQRHGEGAKEYRDAMDSEYGWEYILSCFSKYVTSR